MLQPILALSFCDGFLGSLLRHSFPFMYPTLKPIPTLNPIRLKLLHGFPLQSPCSTLHTVFFIFYAESLLLIFMKTNSTAAGLVYDFIAGGDLERRKRAQDLLLQHHGHCKLLVVEVGQGARH